VIQDYAAAGLELMRECGDVVRIYAPRRMVFFFDPRHVRHVLRGNVLNFPKSRDYEALRPLLGNGLFVSDGDLWTRQRRLIAPEFRAAAVGRFLPVIVESVEELFTRWERTIQAGGTTDVADDMMSLTLWIVGGSMFQTGFREEAEKIGRALEICLEQGTLQMLLMGLLQPWMPTPGNLRARRAERTLDTIVRDLIVRARAAGEGKDVLSRLVFARHEDGSRMDERQIIDEVKSLVLAGHETTSLALSWTFYLLAQNPEVEDRLHREAARVIGDRPVTPEMVPDLVYTRQVFLETMRLYPPVPGVSREVLEDDVVDGVRLTPRRELVVVSAYATHRHPGHWERPSVYAPERFAPERIDAIEPFSYFPFLLGRRACVGEHFAMLEGVVALAMIANRYKLERVSDHPIAHKPISTLRLAEPLPMRLRRR
jgi:cytochrome P450